MVSEYTIPDEIPQEMPEERRWETDWAMLGPSPDNGCVHVQQLLMQMGDVPDAFKGIFFELVGEFVTRDRFLELIMGFGPLPSVSENLMTLFSQRWFFNFMVHQEADRWLKYEAPGSFLVRFWDPTTLSRFAVCYVVPIGGGATRVVQERVVSNFPQPGFVYESPGGPILCANLFEVLDVINRTTPLNLFANPLVEEIWFHGGVSADEATELLRTRPAGTFLVRFSTQQHSYTISQIVEDQQFISVTHTRLTQTPEGWFRDTNTGKQWPTLENFLQLANLTSPLVNRVPMIRKLGAQMSVILAGPPESMAPPGSNMMSMGMPPYPPPSTGPVFVE